MEIETDDMGTSDPDSDDDNQNDNGDGNDDNSGDDGDDSSSSCTDDQTSIFVEEGGLLTIEAENSRYESTEWSLEQTITDFSDEGYLVWSGNNSLGTPGNGLLTYTIRISTPGTYRFIWRSYITIGEENGEYNDSWLRIPDADHFYGLKSSNGHIVYPKGTTLDPIPESEGQDSTEPEGGGADGWFKIYEYS